MGWGGIFGRRRIMDVYEPPLFAVAVPFTLYGRLLFIIWWFWATRGPPGELLFCCREMNACWFAPAWKLAILLV